VGGGQGQRGVSGGRGAEKAVAGGGGQCGPGGGGGRGRGAGRDFFSVFFVVYVDSDCFHSLLFALFHSLFQNSSDFLYAKRKN